MSTEHHPRVEGRGLPLSLSEAEPALLPEHRAGLIELSGAEMDGVRGGHLNMHPLSDEALRVFERKHR